MYELHSTKCQDSVEIVTYWYFRLVKPLFWITTRNAALNLITFNNLLETSQLRVIAYFRLTEKPAYVTIDPELITNLFSHIYSNEPQGDRRQRNNGFSLSAFHIARALGSTIVLLYHFRRGFNVIQYSQPDVGLVL